tara:strand:+ start:256 stop:627 length:372 start_codon:yes stop_codon:yes gene_type:complete
MATAQTYRRQFNKTFKIVDEVASEYYDLLGQEKIGEDDNFICTYSDLEKFDSADFKWLEMQDKKIEEKKESIKLFEKYIRNLKNDILDIERMSRNMKETIKNGNGIDKDYCKYLLECEKEKEK